MTPPKDARVKAALESLLQPGEELKYWAFGIKQPSPFIWMPLVALAVLPGFIALMLLTKNFAVGLTNKRLLIAKVDSALSVTQASEYSLDELRRMKATTTTGPIFTYIKIIDATKPFRAKFHRAFSKTNRENAMAIGQAIATPA